MTDDQPWTIGRLLTWTTDFLRERQAPSPRLDAEVLLAHARGCPRIELYTAFDELAGDELRTRFRELVRERASGKPVAYLVGNREFFSLSFDVTLDVLIPRPETEQLVVRGLDLMKEQMGAKTNDAPLRIADVGVGSGVLSICLAKHLPTAQVVGVDISEATLEVARRNAAKHDVDQRITFLKSDLFSAVDAEDSFDLIVSNPPYVKTGEWERLDGDVREFEPRLALDGGPDGTDVIARLIPQATSRLKPDGWLLIEISPTTADAVEQMLDAEPKLERFATEKDLAGLPRMVQAQRTEAA